MTGRGLTSPVQLGTRAIHQVTLGVRQEAALEQQLCWKHGSNISQRLYLVPRVLPLQGGTCWKLVGHQGHAPAEEKD